MLLLILFTSDPEGRIFRQLFRQIERRKKGGREKKENKEVVEESVEQTFNVESYLVWRYSTSSLMLTGTRGLFSVS